MNIFTIKLLFSIIPLYDPIIILFSNVFLNKIDLLESWFFKSPWSSRVLGPLGSSRVLGPCFPVCL